MLPLHVALDLKIHQVYEMQLLHQSLQGASSSSPPPSSSPDDAIATDDNKTSRSAPLLLAHMAHCVQDSLRILLKLLATGFPRGFDVNVMIEALQATADPDASHQVQSAIQEVLENLLPAAYKHVVLPLVFSDQLRSSKAAQKLAADVTAQLATRCGGTLQEQEQQHQDHPGLAPMRRLAMALLAQVVARPSHRELTCLVVDFLLTTRAAATDKAAEDVAEDDVLSDPARLEPLLAANDLVRELLVAHVHQ